MKHVSLVIAALLATSGIALANGTTGVAKKKVSTAPTTAQVQSSKADCKAASKAEQPVQPRLGYIGDPWIVPPFM